MSCVRYEALLALLLRPQINKQNKHTENGAFGDGSAHMKVVGQAILLERFG